MLCRLAPLLCLPLVVACVNDGAAYVVDGPQHAISVVREQNFFWQKKVALAVVVSRLPDCQRKHRLGEFSPVASVELWQPGPGTYVFKVGDKMFVTETRTCIGFAKMDEEPPGGLGQQVGTYALKRGVFVFTPSPKVPSGEAVAP